MSVLLLYSSTLSLSTDWQRVTAEKREIAVIEMRVLASMFFILVMVSLL